MEFQQEQNAWSRGSETDADVAQRWIESQRNSYRHELPLDARLTLAVIDRLGAYERARSQHMLGFLWQLAQDDFERELVLDVFHESTGPCFHPRYIADELSWIGDVLRDASEHLKAYWKDLDKDRPTQAEWEQQARETMACFPPDKDNLPYVLEALLSRGIGPERLAEFWPSSDYVPYTPEELVELERFFEENRSQLMEGDQGSS